MSPVQVDAPTQVLPNGAVTAEAPTQVLPQGAATEAPTQFLPQGAATEAPTQVLPQGAATEAPTQFLPQGAGSTDFSTAGVAPGCGRHGAAGTDSAAVRPRTRRPHNSRRPRRLLPP